MDSGVPWQWAGTATSRCGGTIAKKGRYTRKEQKTLEENENPQTSISQLGARIDN